MNVDEKPGAVRGVEPEEILRSSLSFPPNSHKSMNHEDQKKKRKIIKGKVVTRKKSLGKRLSETFLGENLSNVLSYVVYEVLVPAAKSTLDDMVTGGFHKLLFGGTINPRSRRDGGRSYVSYDSVSRSTRDSSIHSRNRARHIMDDIILESRGEAEEVLGQLVDMIEEYGVASVSDFYHLVDMESTFTDDKYGWENLSRASVSRVREGYLINLPRPIVID